MPVLVAALLLGVLFFVLLGRVGRANLRQFVDGWRVPLGSILALASVVLGMTGRVNFAFLAGCGASYLLFGTVPFIWRTSAAPNGSGGRDRSASAPPKPATAMSKKEALSVLGLREGASKDEIRAAHRRLIQQTHPDKGGTNYLAAKINEAKDVLLG